MPFADSIPSYNPGVGAGAPEGGGRDALESGQSCQGHWEFHANNNRKLVWIKVLINGKEIA